MVLFIAVHSMVGFSFFHSIVQLSLLLATFEMIFASRGCGYVQSNHSSGLPYDKIVITVEE